MRLIAIPIARARAGVTPVSTFLAQRTPIKPSFTSHQLANHENAAAAGASPSSAKDVSTSTSSKSPTGTSSAQSATASEPEEQLPLTTRLMNRASAFWIDLGREDQKSTLDWKRRTYTLGEKLMDRIEYEEWALKGVDPTLGPSLTAPKGNGSGNDKAEGASKEKTTVDKAASRSVPLLFPSTFLSASSLISSLTRLTAARQPHHRQRMIWCIVGMPLTIPFIVVPVIPNLPFFYLVWRAWSHWRALQSSKYLSDLLQQGRVMPTPSDELDRIFALPAPPKDIKKGETNAVATNTDPKPKPASDSTTEAAQAVDYESLLVLKPFHIEALSKAFNMERQLSVDLHRARQQTIRSIKAGQLDKLEAAAKQQDSVPPDAKM